MSVRIDIPNRATAHVLVDGIIKYSIEAETCITKDEYNKLMKLLNQILQMHDNSK